MKTDDLIAAIAADTLPQPTVARRLTRVLPIALAVSASGLALFLGPRPDLASALGSVVVLKTVLPLVLAVLAGACVFALAHPGLRNEGRASALGLFVALLAAAFVVVLARGGLSGLTGALATPDLWTCLLSVPALALPFLGAALWALSAGAPVRPGLTGAIAGLGAGGLAAAIYSFHCNQDIALFVLPAYSIAVLAVALLGAVLGTRVLKW